MLANAWKAQDTAIEDLVYRFPEKGGSVQLRVGVFDRNSGERLPITATDFQFTDRGTSALVSEEQLAR
jgi:hypothetical protein